MADTDLDSSRSPTKRRRITGNSNIDRDSSPDELAASPVRDLKYSRPANSMPQKELLADYRAPIYPDEMSEESPDELDHTVHTYFRNSSTRNATASNSAASVKEEQSVGTGRLSMTPERPVAYRRYVRKTVLRGHRKGVAQAKFSPNGRYIASCCEFFWKFSMLFVCVWRELMVGLIAADATIRIWETQTGKLLQILEGHLAGISTLAWSPDSETLASGSDDKLIRLWNTKTVS